jgi:hypothetical protein
MKNLRLIISAMLLIAIAAIGLRAQTQQPARVSSLQVNNILQRLERSSNKFRNSLNTSLVQARMDETRPQNDINSFVPDFEKATSQFRDQFTQDVLNIGGNRAAVASSATAPLRMPPGPQHTFFNLPPAMNCALGIRIQALRTTVCAQIHI